MNIKINNHPSAFIKATFRYFFERLTQNPGFYNIKYYTKNKSRQGKHTNMW